MTHHETAIPPEQPYLAAIAGIDHDDYNTFNTISLPFAEQLLPVPPEDQWAVVKYIDQPLTAALPFTSHELAAIVEAQTAMAHLLEKGAGSSGVAREMMIEAQLFPYSASDLQDRRRAVGGIFSAVQPAIYYAEAYNGTVWQPTPQEAACLEHVKDLPDRLLALKTSDK